MRFTCITLSSFPIFPQFPVQCCSDQPRLPAHFPPVAALPFSWSGWSMSFLDPVSDFPWPQDFILAFCRLCFPVGLIKPGPKACPGPLLLSAKQLAGMKISTSKSEAMVVDVKRVLCPLQAGTVLLQVKESSGSCSRLTVRLTGGLVQLLQICSRCTGPLG